MLSVPLWLWTLYHIVIGIFILLDLVTIQVKHHEITFREALAWTIIWIAVGLAFGILVLWYYGLEPFLLYVTAYVVEKSLSVDNMFVFAVIFSYFAVPLIHQHKTLYIGVVTAAVLRGLFIFAGIKLIEAFHWMTYVFGVILLLSGARLAMGKERQVEPERNPMVRLFRRFLPMTSRYDGGRFITREGGKLVFTPLVIVLIAIETTDVLFAVDSVPAVIAITQDFFIAYTSNISAILGLRALYLLLAVTLFKLRYIGRGLAIVLAFLGVKMLLAGLGVKIPVTLSLTVVLTVIAASVLASILVPEREGSKL